MEDDFWVKDLNGFAIFIVERVPLSALFVGAGNVDRGGGDINGLIELLGDVGPFGINLLANNANEKLVFLSEVEVTSLLQSLLQVE